MKLVLVEWVDSALLGERWFHKSDVEMDTKKCEAVGFLLQKDKAKVILAQSRCPEDGDIVNLIAIPRRCVTSIKEVVR